MKKFMLALAVLISSHQVFADSYVYIVNPMYNQECVDDVKATICQNPNLKSDIESCSASIVDADKGNGRIEFVTRAPASAETKNKFRQAIEHTTRKVVEQK